MSVANILIDLLLVALIKFGKEDVGWKVLGLEFWVWSCRPL